MSHKDTDYIQIQQLAEGKPEYTTMFSKSNIRQKFSMRLQKA